MARQDNDQSDDNPTQSTQEEADGYRPSRRRKPQEEDKPADKPQEAAPDKKLSGFEVFMEQHWEAWLRPVLMIAALGGGVVGYKLNLLPESFISLAVVATILLAAIYGTIFPTLEMIEKKQYRTLLGIAAAVWALSAGYPPMRTIKPRQVLGETVLTEEQKTVKLPVSGASGGPYDIAVSGKIEPSGAASVQASYELTIAGGGGSETVSGELTYSQHQGRSRRGSTHWAEKNDQRIHPLPGSISGTELTLSVDSVDSTIKDGLHVRLHPYDLLMRALLPRIGGVEVPVIGILILLLMIFVETKVGDKKNKTHLAMGAAVTLIFSYQFHLEASPTNLVSPAVSATFTGLLGGGILGGLLGWIARKVSGRNKIRPPKSDKDPKDKDDDE